MTLHETEAIEGQELRELCRATLERNWREGTRDGIRYAYTAPSSGRYPWQWYWDSCFAAIAWRRFDSGRARAELESLLAAATPDGFIGHTIFWAEPVSRIRSLFYNVRSRADFMTATIQPPLLPWAWRLAVGDPAEVPAIVRHQDWIERERDLDGDGLVWIIQPDESGLDASPKFDSTFGWCADGLPGFPLLVRRNRAREFDIARIARAGGPAIGEVPPGSTPPGWSGAGWSGSATKRRQPKWPDVSRAQSRLPGCVSTTTRSRAREWAPPISRGRRWSWR